MHNYTNAIHWTSKEAQPQTWWVWRRKEECAIKIYLKFSAFLWIFIRLHPEEFLCSEIKWQKVLHHDAKRRSDKETARNNFIRIGDWLGGGCWVAFVQYHWRGQSIAVNYLISSWMASVVEWLSLTLCGNMHVLLHLQMRRNPSQLINQSANKFINLELRGSKWRRRAAVVLSWFTFNLWTSIALLINMEN